MADRSTSITHIAGTDVLIDGRYFRQRCAWCDEILVDYDLTLVATLSSDGTPSGLAPWPVGALVRVEGPVSMTLDRGEPLPDDTCAWATLADPADVERSR